MTHAKYFFCDAIIVTSWALQSFWNLQKKFFFLVLFCDLNFKDFYKISILVCQYKPEIYQKNGAVSIITYEGVARNLQSQIPFLQFFLPNLKKKI